MLTDNNIDRVFIIGGLARSGNHLFISWLLSSFDEGEVYYLNNVNLKKTGLTSNVKYDPERLIKYYMVSSDNQQGKHFDESISKNLATEKQVARFIKGNVKIKTLLISVENKESHQLEDLEAAFKKAKKIYKIIITRDILNLFSSRIAGYEKYKKLGIFNTVMRTDKITINYWLENYEASKSKKFINFNYNQFLCSKAYQKKLAKKLDINFKKTKITLNNFGMGSSFKDIGSGIEKYFLRWKEHKAHPLIMHLLENYNIVKILCSDYEMCINLEGDVLTYCNKYVSKN
jgi:hypothetical protein